MAAPEACNAEIIEQVTRTNAPIVFSLGAAGARSLGPEHRLDLSLQPERVHPRTQKRVRSSSGRVEPNGHLNSMAAAAAATA